MTGTSSKWALFADDKILVCLIDDNTATLPSWDSTPPFELIGETFHIKSENASCNGAAIVSHDEATLTPDNLVFMELRASYEFLPHIEYDMASKARELIFWDSQSKFCGKCGAKMQRHTEISKICTNCNREIFPQLSPAILVLVRKEDKALLVHARTFKRPFYGLVAGFVETGENLEECVAREVLEETSLKISNIKYVGSQTWPYPSNLMIGFTADYTSGEIKFADNELSAGDFFDINHLPMLPTYPSLARKIIDQWADETKANLKNNK